VFFFFFLVQKNDLYSKPKQLRDNNNLYY